MVPRLEELEMDTANEEPEGTLIKALNISLYIFGYGSNKTTIIDSKEVDSKEKIRD